MLFLYFLCLRRRRLCVGLFAGLAVHSLYLKYGFPKFTAEWAQRIVPDPLCMQLFLAFVLLMNKPYLLSMGPILIAAVMTFTEKLVQVKDLEDRGAGVGAEWF